MKDNQICSFEPSNLSQELHDPNNAEPYRQRLVKVRSNYSFSACVFSGLRQRRDRKFYISLQKPNRLRKK